MNHTKPMTITRLIKIEIEVECEFDHTGFPMSAVILAGEHEDDVKVDVLPEAERREIYGVLRAAWNRAQRPETP